MCSAASTLHTICWAVTTVPCGCLPASSPHSVVFGIGYGIGLGFFFGLAAGPATGVTVAIELNRAARKRDHHLLWWEALFSAIRAFGFGAGLYRIVGFN